MSTHPRVSALERRQTNLETRVEEVTEDIEANFKQFSRDMEDGFKQLSEYQEKTEARIEGRLDKIEATMATKEDMAAMEARILDAFRQLLTTINPQRPPSE